MTDETYKATGGELRQFVDHLELLEAYKADIAEQSKEVMAELKGRGYDAKVIRKLIAIRKRDKDEVAEEDAIMSMYMEALGV